MLHDKDIRDDLCDYLEQEFGEVRFFDEFPMGRSRADIVMVTRRGLYGIEIKSDADTYQRLERQVKDYDRYFDYNIAVVGSTHATHIREHLPAYWGVISVEELQERLDLYELRKTQPSPKQSLKNQLRLLWKREMANIQKKKGLYKYPGKSRAFVANYLLESIPQEELKALLIEELYQREYRL